jgi:hypothetical protein
MKFVFKDKYIEVRSDGEKDYQFAVSLWNEVVKICRKHNCYHVLGIAKTTIPVTTMEGYKQYQLLNEVGITSQYRIAWVELNPEVYSTYRFIENVLHNRGMYNIKLFSDIEVAKKWLLNNQYN